MNRARAGLGIVAVVAVLAVAGCFKGNITLPNVTVQSGNYYTTESGVQPVDPNSLVSVMAKLRATNREIGDELADGDWKAVAKEAGTLADWALRAAGLKQQATSPETFAAHCQSLATYARSIQQAAYNADRAQVSAGLNETTRLLGLMGQLVK